MSEVRERKAMQKTSSVAGRMVKALSRLRDRHPDMSINQAMILFYIAAHPGVSQREVYGTLGMHNSAASRALAILSDLGSRDTQPLGLISIQVKPEDRRERLLALSPKGIRLMDDIAADLLS